MPRKQHKYHFLYKTTNLKNSKFYIGMHSTSNLNDGYLGSGDVIRRSIRKHGKHNFELQILKFFDSRGDLAKAEKEYVNEDLLKDPMCMNLKPGGNGGWNNSDHQKKATEFANKSRLYLLKNDLIFKESFSKACSERNKKQYELGTRITKPPNWKGRKHSQDTINKIKESKSGQGSGENNSQYGTMWITDGYINKKVKTSDGMPIGWYKGRVTN